MVSGMEVESADGHKGDVRLGDARYMCGHVLAAWFMSALLVETTRNMCLPGFAAQL